MPKKNYFKEVVTRTIIDGYIMIEGALIRVRPDASNDSIVRLSIWNEGMKDGTYYFSDNSLGKLIENLTEIRDVLMNK